VQFDFSVKAKWGSRTKSNQLSRSLNSRLANIIWYDPLTTIEVAASYDYQQYRALSDKECSGARAIDVLKSI
jgi:hypothetical protein